MKKTIFIICLLFTVLCTSQAYEKRNLLQNNVSEALIQSSLVMHQQWVPYPKYADRAGWETLLGAEKKPIIEAGERYLDYQWQVVRATDFLDYERSGNRTTMQKPYNQNINVLSRLLVAELAEGRGRFVDDLINGVFFFCEMTSWAESAHLAAYQKSHRALPDYREEILELRQGDIAQLLAWTYYFMKDEFDKVDPIIANRLRYELQRRELDPFFKRNDFWWMARNYKQDRLLNNWTPWCNANALFCFMLLENNPEELTKAIRLSMESVDEYLNYVKSDGACEEGPSYWGHAAGKLFEYLSGLSLITGGKVNFFSQPQIKKMGEYIAASYIGDEWVVNFADASARANELNTMLVYRYGVAVNSPVMKAMAVMRAKAYPPKLPSTWLDLYQELENLRSLPKLKSETTAYRPPRFMWYPETQFCYMRSGNMFLAAKGGHNNESHNHNDVGTCILAIDNVPLLIDAGVGTYTKKTFSSERYTIWTMQSNYHNLPIINGQPESFGTQYHATQVRADEKRCIFTADIAKAYPEEAAVDSWIRAYQLQKNRLVITDDYRLKMKKAPNQLNFMTWGNVDISEKGRIKLHINKVKATLSYDANVFKPTVEAVELTDQRLSKVWGDRIYRITLTANDQALSGQYRCTVTRDNP